MKVEGWGKCISKGEYTVSGSGPDCKSAANCFGGSNPSSPILYNAG